MNNKTTPIERVLERRTEEELFSIRTALYNR
jgi:hypothetical protein